MKSVTELFAALGGPSSVARLLGVQPSTASEMKRRGSIPAEYWRELILTAKRLRIEGVDADTLAMVHARARADRKGTVPRTRKSGNIKETASVPPDKRSGRFSRFYDVRRPHFTTGEEIRDHVSALREEWDRR